MSNSFPLWATALASLATAYVTEKKNDNLTATVDTTALSEAFAAAANNASPVRVSDIITGFGFIAAAVDSLITPQEAARAAAVPANTAWTYPVVSGSVVSSLASVLPGWMVSCQQFINQHATPMYRRLNDTFVTDLAADLAAIDAALTSKDAAWKAIATRATAVLAPFVPA